MSWSGPFLRGSLYAAKLEHIATEKYFLVVSNNVRNRQLGTALAVRLTTTPKPQLDSIVEMSPKTHSMGAESCATTSSSCSADEVRTHLGTLTPETMAKVDSGLKAALELT